MPSPAAPNPVLPDPLDLDFVNEMVAGVPEATRREAAAEALAAIEAVYAQYGAAKPAWLTEALQRQDSEAEGDYLHFVYAVIATESIRLAARRDVRKHPRGITGVSADTGISLKGFRKFLAGEWLTPLSFEKLVKGLDVTEPAHPALVGLSMLCGTFPMPLRKKLRVFLGIELEGFLAHAGVPRPEWLDEETDWP